MGLLDKFIAPTYLRNKYKIDNSISQDQMFEIAQKHVNSDMRKEASQKLKDKEKLLELSKSEDIEILKGVIENPFVNDEMLANIIVNNINGPTYHNTRICEDAIEKLEDQPLLSAIASNENIKTKIRSAAIYKSKDMALLIKLKSIAPIVNRSALLFEGPAAEKHRTDKAIKHAAEFRFNELKKEMENKTVEKETETEDQLLDKCVDELVMIYTRNPDGFLSDSPSAKPVQDIGRKLNDAGGMDLMLRAHEMFSAKITGIGLARNLEMVWDGIGSWRG